MCLYPLLINNKKYTSTKKNGGVIPPFSDIRTTKVPIGCGKCMECRKQEARKWQVRLLEDIKEHKNGKFITLTFSNKSYKHLDDEITRLQKTPYIAPEGYKRDNEIATLGVRRFLERWRKEYKKSVRHWLITELGHKGTENIHLHGIIWTDYDTTEIVKHWSYGFVWKGYYEYGKLKNYVNEATVNYCTKYLHKVDFIHKTYKGIVLTSDGIGKAYTKQHDAKKNKYNGTDTIETYRTRSGHKINMPVYWRNKIYTDEEREMLWIQRLDKQERWVCGEKIDVSKTEKHYYEALEYYRKINKQLGYGDNKKDWAREKYEQERRIIIQETRKRNTKDASGGVIHG